MLQLGKRTLRANDYASVYYKPESHSHVYFFPFYLFILHRRRNASRCMLPFATTTLL